MLERILRFSIEHRWLVVLAVAGGGRRAAASSLAAACRSTPCPTSPTARCRSTPSRRRSSPTEVEKQVTFPIETALAGIPGPRVHALALAQRLLAGDGGLRATTSTSTSRASRSRERLAAARESLPPGAEPMHGADLDRARRDLHVDGRVRASARRGRARRSTASRAGRPTAPYLTPEGERLRTRRRAARPTCARCRTGSSARSSRASTGVAGVDAIGGYVKQYHVQPDPRELAAYGLTFHDVIEALERNNVSTGAGYVEHNGEAYVVRAAGRLADRRGARRRSSSPSASGTPIRVARRRRPSASAASCAPAAPARTARRSSSARR